jgi:hypothetical protein
MWWTKRNEKLIRTCQPAHEPQNTWRSFAWPSSSCFLMFTPCTISEDSVYFFPGTHERERKNRIVGNVHGGRVVHENGKEKKVMAFFLSLSCVHPTHTSAHGAHDLPFSLLPSSHSFHGMGVFIRKHHQRTDSPLWKESSVISTAQLGNMSMKSNEPQMWWLTRGQALKGNSMNLPSCV